MTGPTWRCSDCDTYNGVGARVCAVCETPRGAADSGGAAGAPPPKKTEPKKTEPKKTAVTRKPTTVKKPAEAKSAGKRAAAPKKPATAGKAPATGAPVTGGRRPPLRTGTGVSGAGGLSVPGLEWECPVCSHRMVGELWCDMCGALWSSADTTPLYKGPVFGGSPRPSAVVRPTPREPTRGEVLTACGCLLVIAAAAVTLVVLLILNWSSVTSLVTGSDSSKPSPAPSWGGPCPKRLAGMLPEGAGARLVAAYSREDLEERYAFCRAKKGKVYYFFKKGNGEPYDSPREAEKSGDGYVVDFFPQKTSYHFRGGEVAAHDEDGKEIWKGELTPEATVE